MTDRELIEKQTSLIKVQDKLIELLYSKYGNSEEFEDIENEIFTFRKSLKP